MAFPLYFNMEKLALEVAEDHILKMTNNNFEYYECAKSLMPEIFSLNLKHGYVALTMLVAFFESMLNTIILMWIPDSDQTKLKASIKTKTDYIKDYYSLGQYDITGEKQWYIHVKAEKVRNELIHFKKNKVGDGVFLEDFEIGGEMAGMFFTKNNFDALYNNYIDLAKLIATKCQLKIYDKIHIIECQGRDNLNTYIYDEKAIKIDPTRIL